MGWRPRVYVTSEDALKQLLPLFALLAGLTDEQLEELLTLSTRVNMNSYKPDWSMIMTIARSEEELAGFHFDGPGWYHHNDDTMLVIPLDRSDAETWNHQSAPHERFEFHVYNGRNPSDVFNQIVNAPVRSDQRGS